MVQRISKAWLATAVILFLWCSDSLALFENEGLSARYLSLGGGCVALSDEPSAMTSNPAGLGFYQKKGVQLSWSQLFNMKELSSGDLYFAYHPARIFSINGLTLGLGLNIFGQPDYYQETTLSFSFGYRVKNYLALGTSVKYMKASFPAPYPDLSAVSYDLGVLLRVEERVQIGGATKNLNKPEMVSGSEDVPRVWDLGVALHPFEDVILTIDLVKDSDFEHQLRFGQDIALFESLSMRFGLATEPVTYALGAGLRWEKGKIDYVFLAHPTLGGSSKISFSFEW